MSIKSILPQGVVSYNVAALTVRAEILSHLPVGIADLYGARRTVVKVAQRALQIGDFSHKRGQQGSFPALPTLMSAAAVNPCQRPGEPPFRPGMLSVSVIDLSFNVTLPVLHLVAACMASKNSLARTRAHSNRFGYDLANLSTNRSRHPLPVSLLER